MSTTPYLKLALGQYVDSTTTQQYINLCNRSSWSTINDAISTIPGTQVVAGVNGSVPETTKGQHDAFTDPAASAIQTAVTNNQVGVPCINQNTKAVIKFRPPHARNGAKENNIFFENILF